MHKKLKFTLRSFKNHLVIKRGLMPITVKGYSECMRRVLLQLGNIRPSSRKFRRYVAAMYKKNYSYSHIVNTCLAIERYGEFCHRRLKFGRPNKPKPIIKETLSEAEIALMLHAAKNIRERAIFALLAYSGIRNNELCNLRVCDVDIPGNFLSILAGKGKKDGMVCIAPECGKIVVEYLEKHPRHGEDFLFTTLRHSNQYHTGDLRKLIKVLARRAGIAKRVYPHEVRHSLATNMLYRGASIFAVKDQLRHAYIETTMIYLRSTIGHLQSQYQHFHPSYA